MINMLPFIHSAFVVVRGVLYEDYKFSELSGKPKHSVRANQVAQSAQQGLSGKAEKISSKAAETKHVNRLGGLSLLMKVDANDGKSTWIDVCSSSRQVFEGDDLTAFGPVVKVGEKQG